MRKIHTYFEVQIETPIGDYNDYIDAVVSNYMKTNNINFKYATFLRNRDLYILQQKKKDEVRDIVIDFLLEKYSNTKYDEYIKFNQGDRIKIFKEIRGKHKDSIENLISENYKPIIKQGHERLIEMCLFKKFIASFSDCHYLNWGAISANQYYDWDLECLQVGKKVLNWGELSNNQSIHKLIADLSEDEFTALDLPIKISDLKQKFNKGKTLFVIKEYSGILQQYFFIKNDFEKIVKINLPNITKIIWLDEYSAPLKFLTEEKLKFDLSNVDYIYSLNIENDIGEISQKALEISKELGLKIYDDWSKIDSKNN